MHGAIQSFSLMNPLVLIISSKSLHTVLKSDYPKLPDVLRIYLKWLAGKLGLQPFKGVWG